MNKEDLVQKNKEAEDYLSKLRVQITEGEAQIQQMRNAEQQILGRIQTYQEFLQETQDPPPNVPPIELDVESEEDISRK